MCIATNVYTRVLQRRRYVLGDAYPPGTGYGVLGKSGYQPPPLVPDTMGYQVTPPPPAPGNRS